MGRRPMVAGLAGALMLLASGQAHAFTLGETSAALGTQGTLNASGGSNPAAIRKSVTDGLGKVGSGATPGGKLGKGGKAGKGGKVASGFGGGAGGGKGAWASGGALGGKTGGGKGGWASGTSTAGKGWATASAGSAGGKGGWAVGGSSSPSGGKKSSGKKSRN